MAVAAEVVACQIYQHDVLSILLGIVAQILSTFAISLCIASTLGGAGNRVDVGSEFTRRRTVGSSGCCFNTTVCFWRRTEDAETTEVKVEQIR